MLEAECTVESLAKIEEKQADIRIAVSGWDPSVLALRPPNGQWSVLENVRHLLFAEQGHLGRLGVGDVVWSPYGFTPETMRRQRKLPPLDDTSALRIEDVLGAWEAVHADLRAYLQTDTPQVRKALERNLRHLRGHARVIDRLLRRLA